MSNDPALSKPFIRPAEFRDVCELSRNMREADRKEVWHSSRGYPFMTLCKGVEASEDAFAIEWQDKTVALFGVVPFDGGGAPGCSARTT